MCLEINKKLTLWWKFKLFFRRSATFYKRVVVRSKLQVDAETRLNRSVVLLANPWMAPVNQNAADFVVGLRSEFNDHFWEQGWNKSDRPSKKLTYHEETFQQVNQGIHTYAESLHPAYIDGYLIEIKVKGYARDFIAAGDTHFTYHPNHEAVFTKVWVTKKEWKRIMAEMEKVRLRDEKLAKSRCTNGTIVVTTL